jgi:hypothetical protein
MGAPAGSLAPVESRHMDDSATNQETRRGRWWVRGARGLREVWVGVGVTLVLLAAAEGVSRMILAAMPRLVDPRSHADLYPAEPWVAQMYAEKVLCGQMRWEPYLYWRRKACSGEYVNVDAMGLRRTWAAPAAPGRRPLRIFFFGGSAAWGTGARDEHTIPSELAKYLAAAGIYAQVVNYGETGYVSTQSVIALLRELQRGHRPDVALFYIGPNEMLAALAESDVATPLNEEHRRQEFDILRRGKQLTVAALRTVAAHSALGRLMRVPAAPLASTAWAVRPGTADDLMRALDVNVRTVRALAATYGFGAEFYWEPFLAAKTSRTAYEERMFAQDEPFRGWILKSEERVRRTWAAGGSDDLVYLGDLFIHTREPRFIDARHTGEAAYREVAEAIGRHLRADGRLRPAADEKALPGPPH